MNVDLRHQPLSHWPYVIATCVTLLAARCPAEVIEKKQQLGPVIASLQLDPAEPLIGDAVTLTLTVVAEPNVELLLPEFGEALDRFTILDYAPRESLTDDGKTLAIQTYRLQPATSGAQSIPPILVEFIDRRPNQQPAPDGLDAYELLTPRLDFTVVSVLPDDASAELIPPLGELQPLSRSTGRVWLWWLIGTVVLIAGTAPAVWRAVQRRQRLARRRSAYEIARARLDQLVRQPIPTAGELDAYFVELSDIIRQYLGDRFDYRAADLTTEEFLESVSDSPDLSAEHQMLLRSFLNQADLVKFAGAQPDENRIRQALVAAGRFLDETQDDAPLIDEVANESTPTEEASHA